MSDVLYGIRLVKVAKITEQEPDWVEIETPQQLSWSPQIEAGQRAELRGGGKLVATIEDDDELLGIDLTFDNAAMDGEAWAVIDGGTWSGTKYTPPALGAEPTRFMCKVYQAQYAQKAQHQSDEEGFILFSFPSCTGSVASVTQNDRQFTAPQFTIKARGSKDGLTAVPCYSWKKLEELEGDEESDD